VKVDGAPYRSIWVEAGSRDVRIVDQTRLPHEFVVTTLANRADAEFAIREMQVRGAPLIGVTAAYGVALQMREDASDAALEQACQGLLSTRPTAVNLRWALEEMRLALASTPIAEREARALARAAALADEDVELCRAIGEHGLPLLERARARRGGEGPLNLLTHCNAGWLATVDWGTALAPIYLAHDRGLPVHVWVDETRPRNQGALTAWELGQHGVPHTIVADNAGGQLMQSGRVDLVITGSDRTTATGDVCNKIGTYLKALAARANRVPFYVALPYSTIDWGLRDGVTGIPIEQRDAVELRQMRGRTSDGDVLGVELFPGSSAVANPAFDITPAALVDGLVTERGVCAASEEGLLELYPEQRNRSSAP